jgi:hypothetical protein
LGFCVFLSEVFYFGRLVQSFIMLILGGKFLLQFILLFQLTLSITYFAVEFHQYCLSPYQPILRHVPLQLLNLFFRFNKSHLRHIHLLNSNLLFLYLLLKFPNNLFSPHPLLPLHHPNLLFNLFYLLFCACMLLNKHLFPLFKFFIVTIISLLHQHFVMFFFLYQMLFSF